MIGPCKNCPRKGCGAYHDICPEYNKWKREEEEKKKRIKEGKKYNGREYISDSVFKSRTHGAFKGSKKERKKE